MLKITKLSQNRENLPNPRLYLESNNPEVTHLINTSLSFSKKLVIFKLLFHWKVTFNLKCFAKYKERRCFPLANTVLRLIGYNCHGCRNIYLSTFPLTLLGIVGSCGLQRIYLNFIRPSYKFFYRFLQRTGARPLIDHAEIVWRSYRDEVSVANHRNLTWRPCGFRIEAARR